MAQLKQARAAHFQIAAIDINRVAVVVRNVQHSIFLQHNLLRRHVHTINEDAAGAIRDFELIFALDNKRKIVANTVNI